MTTVRLTRRDACTPQLALTRSLLGYGVIAGPFYVAVSLAQALTRDGFDLSRHAWSLLANGDLGWLQITNLVVTGAMVIAFAVGLGRALPNQRWAPRLVGAYGASLIVAGIFRADPAAGFPVGTPADASDVSWHGPIHFAAGAVGFGCLVAACLVLARHFSQRGARGAALASRVVGIAFLAAFVGLAAGGGSAATTIAFVIAVVAVSAWMSAVAAHLYRAVRQHPSG